MLAAWQRTCPFRLRRQAAARYPPARVTPLKTLARRSRRSAPQQCRQACRTRGVDKSLLESQRPSVVALFRRIQQHPRLQAVQVGQLELDCASARRSRAPRRSGVRHLPTTRRSAATRPARVTASRPSKLTHLLSSSSTPSTSENSAAACSFRPDTKNASTKLSRQLHGLVVHPLEFSSFTGLTRRDRSPPRRARSWRGAFASTAALAPRTRPAAPARQLFAGS